MEKRDNHDEIKQVPRATSALPPVAPTAKERRRASRVRRRAQLHEVPLAAMPHEPAVVRSRVHGAPLPTLSDLVVAALAHGVSFGVRRTRRLVGRIVERLLGRALPGLGRVARRVDSLSGGAVTRRF